MAKSTVGSQLDILAKHGIARLSEVSEFQISIVRGRKGDLGTTITNLHSLQCFVCLHVSYLNKESMDTMIFTLRYQSCIENAVCGRFSQTARPELDRSNVGSVENNLLRMLIVGCCSLQILHITSMAHFCLSICSSDLQIINER